MLYAIFVYLKVLNYSKQSQSETFQTIVIHLWGEFGHMTKFENFSDIFWTKILDNNKFD